MSVFPVHYFLSSPYMLKEMHAALLERAPYLMRKHRQQLTRLRRADAACSSLIDDKDRVILAPAVPLPTPTTRPRHTPSHQPSPSHDSDSSDTESNTDPSSPLPSPPSPSPDPSPTPSHPTSPPTQTSTLTLDTAAIAAVPTSAIRTSPSPSPSPSPTSKSAFRYPERPLLLFWLDGAQRYLPFNLALHTLTTHPLPHAPPPLALVSGGSLGLRSSILDHKSSMHTLLAQAGRTYIPHTHPFTTADPHWPTQVQHWLAEGAADEFAIVKPSEGLKQKGLLVLRREEGEGERVLAHVREWRKYGEWVLQTLVTDPFCVSGLDLGLVKGSPAPAVLYPTEAAVKEETPSPAVEPPPTKAQREPPAKRGRRRTLEPLAATPLKQRRFQFPAQQGAAQEPSASPSRQNKRKRKAALPAQHKEGPVPASPLSTTSQPSASPSSASPAQPITSSPSPSSTPPPTEPLYPRAGPGQLPSDSGRPLDCLGLYKVHFRLYALLRHDSVRDEYALFICDLFKLYHAESPSATIAPGREKEALASKLLTASSNDTATLVPPSSPLSTSPLLSLSSPSSPAQSISNSLALRLGNDILSPSLTSHFLPPFHALITDCISLALPHLTPHHPHLALHSFQLYGFDLLWDTLHDQPVLLEVNENVGQGIHPKEVMCGQGMEGREYERLKRYWKEEYRKGFSEGVVSVTVDDAIGKERGGEGVGVWKEVKRWAGGVTDRAPRGTRPAPKASGWKAKRASKGKGMAAPVDDDEPPMASTPVQEAANAPTSEPVVSLEEDAPPPVLMARQSRRSSHRRLAEALEHAKVAAAAGDGGDKAKPFLTGIPEPRGAGGEEGRAPRSSRAELQARYAVRARRRSVEGGPVARAGGEADARQVEAVGVEMASEVQERPVAEEESEASVSSREGRVASAASSRSGDDAGEVVEGDAMAEMSGHPPLVFVC